MSDMNEEPDLYSQYFGYLERPRPKVLVLLGGVQGFLRVIALVSLFVAVLQGSVLMVSFWLVLFGFDAFMRHRTDLNHGDHEQVMAAHRARMNEFLEGLTEFEREMFREHIEERRADVDSKRWWRR